MKHDRQPLVAYARALGVALTAERAEMLATYEEILRARAVPLGLLGAGDVGRVRERHILDCLRAAAVPGAGERMAVDLGAGAGLPGVVVAIARPDIHVTAVDARRRRVAFLEMVIEAVGVGNVRPLHARVEAMADGFDLAFARAFGRADVAWRAAARLLRTGGRLVYFAGGGADVGDPFPVDRSTLAATITVPAPPVLESSGPLVIMTRQ